MTKERVNNMKNFYWHHYEMYELDYSDDKFIGIVEMEFNDENKIECQIMLEDVKDQEREQIIIGRITSDADCFAGTRYHAVNLLLNEEFCLDCWNSSMKKNKKQKSRKNNRRKNGEYH